MKTIDPKTVEGFVQQFFCCLLYKLRLPMCQSIAGINFFALARFAGLLNSWEIMPRSWPLAYYRDKSLYVIRTDALDHFGTRLEKRFGKKQIGIMLENAGLKDIHFSDKQPYSYVVGIKDKICAV